MRKFVTAPLRAVAPVPRHVRHAVQTRRIGNFHVDHGLDALTFFLSDVQTGFGPFIAVYLAANHWSSAEVGTALAVGTVVQMVAQVPAGAAIDAIPAKRFATLVALLALMGSAVLLALFPYWIPVVGAEVLHGIASCMLIPAVAAVTLSRVGRSALAPRLGRNARFSAVGNALGAGVMGFVGATVAASAPFWVTAATTIPAIIALAALPPRHETQPRAPYTGVRKASGEAWRVLRDRRLLAFIVCVGLFHGSNAFILPLAVTRLTDRIGGADSNFVLAGCLIVSQATVALFAPAVGRWADKFGRRPVLLVGFAAVPLHALLLAPYGGAYWIIGLQLLDGMGGAMFGVLQPLVAADLTHGTNRFNLVIGVFGLAVGLGATFSSAVGGRVAAAWGDATGFLFLAGIGVAAVAAVWLLMPETRGDERPNGRALLPEREKVAREA